MTSVNSGVEISITVVIVIDVARAIQLNFNVQRSVVATQCPGVFSKRFIRHAHVVVHVGSERMQLPVLLTSQGESLFKQMQGKRVLAKAVQSECEMVQCLCIVGAVRVATKLGNSFHQPFSKVVFDMAVELGKAYILSDGVEDVVQVGLLFGFGLCSVDVDKGIGYRVAVVLDALQ